MLALNVSIPCQTRSRPSCEVATWNLLRKSCNKRACHRVVPATWERGVKGTQVIWSEWRTSCSGFFRVVAFYFTSVFTRPVEPSSLFRLRACLAYSCKRDRYSNDNNHYYKNNGPIRSVLLEPLAKRYGLALAAI